MKWCRDIFQHTESQSLKCPQAMFCLPIIKWYCDLMIGPKYFQNKIFKMIDPDCPAGPSFAHTLIFQQAPDLGPCAACAAAAGHGRSSQHRSNDRTASPVRTRGRTPVRGTSIHLFRGGGRSRISSTVEKPIHSLDAPPLRYACAARAAVPKPIHLCDSTKPPFTLPFDAPPQ